MTNEKSLFDNQMSLIDNRNSSIVQTNVTDWVNELDMINEMSPTDQSDLADHLGSVL